MESSHYCFLDFLLLYGLLLDTTEDVEDTLSTMLDAAVDNVGGAAEVVVVDEDDMG